MAFDKDVRKLGRSDLLDLLLEQSRENDRLSQEVKLLKGELGEASEGLERLKAKLDAKDEQIKRLTAKLDGKDAQIARLKFKLDEKDGEISRLQSIDLDNPGSLAAAALKASGVMQAAEQAAAQYLEGARQIEIRRRELYQATVKRCQEMEQMSGIR